MNQNVNANRLFYGSCFALITTAFSFAIRAAILPELGEEFGLNAEQLGFITSMWFLGFPISMIIGGLVYNTVGPRIIMVVAFVMHVLGIVMTIYSEGYTSLLVSSLILGIGTGCTEAACNPMIADSYAGLKMNKMLSRFHMWFPGGIVVGSLIALAMNKMGLGWQAQFWMIMIPTLIYAFLFWGQAFPKPKVEGAMSLSENFKAMLNPLFIFIFLCMALTAISEFGPQQWTALIMAKSGAEPLLILALVTGLMAVGRFFAGPVIGQFGQTGVLLGSAVFATIGIFMFSSQTGAMAYVAAIFFALGVCYFWPTMIGFVAEKIPLSGALGLSLVGGMGMFSSSIFQPIIGSWLDGHRVTLASQGLTGDALDLAAGQATLLNMTTFPIILIVAFTILLFWVRARKAKGMHSFPESEVLQQPQL